ncbi:aminotransferase class I/II-fold pyridoxal phosphate-dependent enzyme [Ginsengibacter hankyongi]|uniref:Aminotransferase class I/II-fold pyridoxal phosphate-dependent enzyme n=1 Tax=Ginsengibacter hankyongi TaxID=2607284 RepID=A0A5J5IHJ7_9BACT|nr:aminotransferase class I/II-fold pyridoxal phosphate-dependent enzyme [Ginsengibacter hankyongi]KAA9038746.1 aminotransferase class I/II-fold pyridoxal phosphate-dependent enzyme [Ginsengibacter hankyongi]
MSKSNTFYDTVDQVVSYGIDKGILHLYTGNQPFDGPQLIVNGRDVINFGSCSYLGLEFDKRLKESAREAIEKYGTQFSESRAYVSLGLYNELENLLEQIFDAPCVITPTTTLGHIANIPVLVEDGDAVIMDQQVHNSVQTAVQLVKARGVHIELLRHNRVDLLETRIRELRHKHKKIWYMADGIYSMFGDCTPVDAIYSLMDKYAELYYYVDDAHGMSIHGKHGRGFVLSYHAIHPKMAMTTSLNKAFASGGGVLVYGNKEMARKVGTVGGPLLSSGPMQPSGLGAAIAAARIHLSREIILMQDELKDNIRFASLMLAQYKLPVISKPGGAIFFVGVSLPKLGHNLVRRMLDAGFYVNLGVFPTVPMKQTGIRFTITRLHSYREIESMIATLAEVFPIAMREENISLPEIYKAFKLPMPEDAALTQSVDTVIKQALQLKLVHYTTIGDIDRNEWNEIFEGKGTFDWDGLKLLEKVFEGNDLPEDNWDFDYLLVKDLNETVIAATFLTASLWKDDMLSPASVSKQIEARRVEEPYYLTSKVLCSGSLITEGEHLYINTGSSLWKDAVLLLFDKIYALQELHEASHIVLRDFHGMNEELDHLMVDNGFFRITMPDSYLIPSIPWNNAEEFYKTLSHNSRNQLRKRVLRNADLFTTEVITTSDWQEEIEYWYQLYNNVKSKSLELNTFALPFKLFSELAKNESWEILQLTLKNPVGQQETMPCCVVFSYRAKGAYIPIIIGLDYTCNLEYGIYRQALYQLVLQARKSGAGNIFLGFSAGIEKQKLGAVPVSTFAYMHSRDSYQMEVLSAVSVLAKTGH